MLGDYTQSGGEFKVEGGAAFQADGVFDFDGREFVVLNAPVFAIGDPASSSVTAVGDVVIWGGSQVTIGSFAASGGNIALVADAGTSLHVLGDYTQSGGEFKVEGGAAFRADGVFEHAGESSGTLLVFGGSSLRVGQSLRLSDDQLRVFGAVSIGDVENPAFDTVRIGEGGSLVGSGTIEVQLLINGGTISTFVPGETLLLEGDFIQNGDGRLAITLGDPVAGGSTALEVDGSAALAGHLELSLPEGTTPTPGSSWTVLTANSIEGAFSTVSPCGFDVVYLDKAVVVTFTAAGRPGDFNCDGLVNGEDLGVLLVSWGPCDTEAPCPGDVNGDGAVNGVDLAILLFNWG